jgi:hypothetical protein
MKISFKKSIAALLRPGLLLACKKTTGDTINNGGPGPASGGAAPSKQVDCSAENLQQGKSLVNFPSAYYRLAAVLKTAQGYKSNYA